MAAVDRARKVAAELVAGVTGEGILLSEAQSAERLEALEPSERARAQRLAAETLRQLPRADRVLKPYLRRMPPEAVRAVLRLAVVEMMALGTPPHAAVAEAVALVRAAGRRAEPFAGLTNAVLRKVAAQVPPVGAEAQPENADAPETKASSKDKAAPKPVDWQKLPVPELPGWLRGRMMSAWGKQAVQRIEAAHLAGAPLDLTPRDGDAAALAELVGGEALPTGSVRLQGPVQVSALPGYGEGSWWVQDAAAAIPARLLSAQPGERVLDLCAAPGGKTLQLAATGATVTAVDISEQRLARLEENLARTELQAEIVAADVLGWSPDTPVDAVLLDAPCSATGTIRRHPDLPHAKSAEGLRPLFALQAEMLDHAVGLLAPGGRLVFCTCALLPEEGEAQLAGLLERHPELEPDPAALSAEWIEEGWRAGPASLRLRPDFWAERGGMDGFFIACLRRAA